MKRDFSLPFQRKKVCKRTYLCVLKTRTTVSGTRTVETNDVTVVNCEGSAMKHLWPNQGTAFPSFACGDRERHKIAIHGMRYLKQDWSRLPSEYKSVLLLII